MESFHLKLQALRYQGIIEFREGGPNKYNKKYDLFIVHGNNILYNNFTTLKEDV